MKKLFLVAAMTMMLGSIGTVFATDATLDVDNKAGTTKVTYSVTDSYTITIPDEFALDTETVTKEVSASDVFIGNAKKLQVTVSGQNCANGKWYIVDESASTNKFEYTIKDAQNATVANGAVILEVEAGTTVGGSESLKFDLAETVVKAGTYSDLLTFTSSVVDVQEDMPS